MPGQALSGEGESTTRGSGVLKQSAVIAPKTPPTLTSLWFYGATQVRSLITIGGVSQTDGLGELTP